MENIFNRIQFVRGLNPNSENGVFESREDAINYVLDKHFAERPSLIGEPIFLAYESGNSLKGPNVILAIGSNGDGTPSYVNRTFFIDTQKTEEEIEELNEKIEEAISSLSIIPLDSNTIDLSTEKTDNGTVLSGDVKIADYRISSAGTVNYNIIQTEGNKGLYAFVDMNYDPLTAIITFNVNGITKEIELPKDQHVVSGHYDENKESIVLTLADNSKVEIDVIKLIDEWDVLGTASTTPIVLFKDHVSAYSDSHEGVYDWQDVLTADVRLATHIPHNIIQKDGTGQYLYVNGTADNIYYKGNLTVRDALDNADAKVSTSSGNLIYKRPDGLYASAMLSYSQVENKLYYRYSDGNAGEMKEVSFQLNSVKVLDDITYDPTKEVIVIRYIDSQGEYQRIEIPAKDIIEEWIVNNEAHNIELSKYRSSGSGKDILSADAKIYNGDNNILEDKDHRLYVNGIANNIKYDVTGDTTVKDVLDSLSAETVSLNEKIGQEIADREESDERFDNIIGTGFTTDPHENITYKFESLSAKVNSEIERATSAEIELNEKLETEIERSTEKDTEHDTLIETINNTIGTGFTDDPHENITYKFESLSAKVDSESDRLANEIERSTEKDTEHDEAIQTIVDEIGSGFSITNTVRDEINGINNTIAELSANTDGKLESVVNVDHSINVDNTDPVNPVISVNLSEEVEDGKPNIIKLNTDGLYAGVDLEYVFDEQTGGNKLIFKTTNYTKTFDLKTNSVVDKIYYDPSREAIIIEYTVNGHRMPDVVVPVGDLIDEWRVWDGHEGAVQLSKTRIPSGSSEQDILKAEVVISDHSDNIIINDSGSLYVSSSAITKNAEDIAALQGRMDVAEDAIDDLITNQQQLSGALTSEIARSIAKDEELSLSAATNALNIQQEKQRAEEAEINLSSAISAEKIRAISAETALQTAINNEVTRATTEEARIETKLDNEISRTTSEESRIEAKLDAEITRSVNKDNELSSLISSERERAISAETSLQTAINNEVTRATTEEARIETKLDNEISRSITRDDALEISINTIQSNLDNEISRAKNSESAISESLREEISRAREAESSITHALEIETNRAISAETYEALLRSQADEVLTNSISSETNRAVTKETELYNLITAETAARQDADDALENAIDAVTLTFDDTTTVDLNKSNNNVVTANVKVANSDDNIIIVDGEKAGIYAAVELRYNSGTNKIKLVTSAGAQEEIQLNAGALIDNMSYDSVNRSLVIDYTDSNGATHTINFPVNELFNDWNVENPSEHSAIELTKVVNGSGYNDTLSGRVLLTNLDDNVIKIVNNGLYVSGNELSALTAALSGEVVNLIEDLSCLDTVVGSDGACNYSPEALGCVISGATSMLDADKLLDEAICELRTDLLNILSGSDTPTSHMYFDDKLKTDVRLSHGNTIPGMPDSELTITSTTDDEITDTNALRIVNMTGQAADSSYNGLYLSNYWNCGEYTLNGEGTPNNKYKIDESEGASNYNYMNNVRQHDI